MSKPEKLHENILMRRSDANVLFETLCSLLKRLGFDERIRGDHHIFIRGIVRRVSFQSNGDQDAFLDRSGELLLGKKKRRKPNSTSPLVGGLRTISRPLTPSPGPCVWPSW